MEKEVEFLDVNHVLDSDDPAGFITRDFVKPTAVGRVFLNGSSYHPSNVFKSILKGETLRMRRLNEKQNDFQESLDRLKCKSLKSNFPKKLTNRLIENASTWIARFPPNTNNNDYSKILPWATAHPKLLALSERQHELKQIAVVTFKKPANLSTHLIHFRKLSHGDNETLQQSPLSHSCGKCSLCGNWGKFKVNMVFEEPYIENKSTKKKFALSNKLNCRNYGIYAALCNRCPAIYEGQTMTPFKDRWNKHRNDWKKHWHTRDIDDKNDDAALLKHYIIVHIL